jgi:hypothetical protein
LVFVMDDTRTQQALDQLADLFLTGQGPVTTDPPPPTQPPPAASGEALDGPAPIKLGPKLVGPARSAAQPPVAPPLSPKIENEPAEAPRPELDGSPIASIGENQSPLHLQTDAPDDPPQADDFSWQVAVEAVFLGNLPGLSGPWLTQYAQLLAQQEGPVAILHVDDDTIDLELVEPTGQGTRNRGVSLRMPPGGGVLDPVSVLDSLMDSPDAAPSTVLVHLDVQNDKHGLSRALSIEDWTLMCGADDAAVVSGYWMLKTMFDRDQAVAHKRVGLMVMGSDPGESQLAARKVQSASERFLHTPVQLLGWQKQMIPVNLRHLGRFGDTDAFWPALAEWFDRHAVARPVEVDQPAEIENAVETPVVEAPLVQPTVQAPVTEAAAVSTAKQEKVSELFADPPEVAPRKRITPPPVTQLAAPIHTEPAVHASASATEVQPQPAAVAPQASDEPDLVALLMSGTAAVPGGIALEARCPLQPKTQLMLGEDGRLHLLRRHDPACPGEGAEGLGPAMVDLLQARKWVSEHLALLQLTQRQCRFDADREPVLHLFTDRADWATSLIIRLGDSLKLHLLQDIEVAGERAWFCTPLN